MKRLGWLTLAVIAFLAPISSALGQSSLLQGGAWTPGHGPMYVGSGSGQPIVQDSGPASGGAIGLGYNEQLLTVRGTGTAPYANAGTGPFGTNACNYDAPTTNATGYHYLCFSPNALGGGLIAYGYGGGATPLPLQFNINGVLTSLNNTGRTRLTGNVLYYVSNTAGAACGTSTCALGNDSNNGLSPTTPFLTIQEAWNTIAYTLDLNGFNVTVQIADGTYTATPRVLQMGEGPPGVFQATSIAFQGNSSNNMNVSLSGSTAAINCGVQGKGTTQVTFRNMHLQSSGGNDLNAAGCILVVNNLDFGTAGGAQGAQVYAFHGGFITTEGNAPYTISGNAYAHVLAQTDSTVAMHASGVTCSNSPAFSGATVVSQYAGANAFYGGITFTNCGSVTGSRYLVEYGGAYIDVGGAGTSYIPGSTDGAALYGGQYDAQPTPLPGYQIGVNLPTCNAAGQGMHVHVTNGVASPTFGATVSTTGSTDIPVFCNGTAWVYG